MKKIRIAGRIIVILLTDVRLSASFLKNIFFCLFIRLKSSFGGKKFIVIALTEHLGDVIAAEPVSAYLKKENPHSNLYWVCDHRYVALLHHNPDIHKIITVTCFSGWVLLKYFLPKKRVYDLHINNKWCEKHGLVNVKPNNFDITFENYFNKGNLLYAFSRSTNIEMPYHMQPNLHVKQSAPVPDKKYIVLHTGSHNPEKLWKTEYWNELVKFIADHSQQYAVVEIGMEKNLTEVSNSIIDMTGKKDLETIASIIQHAHLFIGIDSGFAHMANALQKEAIILIGAYAGFKNYMPYSGKYEAEKENTIIYHNDRLATLPFSAILPLLQKKLNS